MNRKWKVLGAMFAFVRPYAPLWVPGTLLYSMQSFATGYLISLLLSQLTAAMLAGSAPAVWRTGAVFAGAYLVYFVLLGFAAYQYVKQGERATFDMKKRLFRAFVSAGTEDAGHSGEGIASLNTEADAAAHNLILWGDPSSNAYLARIIDRLPVRWSAEGVTLGAETHDAGRHAPVLIYPNPLNPKRYVVLNSGFTFREYDYLNNARQVPKLPDFAVVDVDSPPTSRAPGRIVQAGFFDEEWKPRAEGSQADAR